jgi:hypothetical protein
MAESVSLPDMPIQKCPLCLDTKNVVSSHLMPAALYEFCTPPGGHPVAVTHEIALESDRQLQHDLLCVDCEKCLNRGGESWLLPLLARLDGPFAFHDMLVTVQPDIVDGDVKAYAAAKNPKIEVDKLVHFAMGVFFKAGVHSWSGSRTEPLIDFGPYTESIRTFLLGESGFPQRMVLMVGVLPPPVKDISFCYPYRGSNTKWFNYLFYACGMEFALGLGKGLTREARQSCIASNPLHPILVVDFTEVIHMNFGEALINARKAKNVEKWLKKL